MEQISIFTESKLIELNLAKEELFDGLKNVIYDLVLPQDWLNDFVRLSDLKYDLVTRTTIWLYTKNNIMGEPFSCCVEVRNKLNEIYFGPFGIKSWSDYTVKVNNIYNTTMGGK